MSQWQQTRLTTITARIGITSEPKAPVSQLPQVCLLTSSPRWIFSTKWFLLLSPLSYKRLQTRSHRSERL